MTQSSFSAVSQTLFINPEMWPVSNPDRSSVYYCVFGVMQQREYRVSIQDVDKLHQRCVETWDERQHSVVDGATDQWQKKGVSTH